MSLDVGGGGGVVGFAVVVIVLVAGLVYVLGILFAETTLAVRYVPHSGQKRFLAYSFAEYRFLHFLHTYILGNLFAYECWLGRDMFCWCLEGYRKR